jgi:hypothetical protein
LRWQEPRQDPRNVTTGGNWKVEQRAKGVTGCTKDEGVSAAVRKKRK